MQHPTENSRVLAILSKRMVEQCLEYLDAQAKLRSQEFVSDLEVAFIASLIGALMYRVTASADAEAPKGLKRAELAQQKFSEMKLDIENAVAAGVTGALQTYTGKSTEFYCTIRIMPPPVNKEPC